MDKPNEPNNYSTKPQKKPPRSGGKNPSHQCLVEEVQAQGEKIARSLRRGMRPPNTAVGISDSVTYVIYWVDLQCTRWHEIPTPLKTEHLELRQTGSVPHVLECITFATAW